MAPDTELDDRLSRLTAPASNGGSAALPAADDLDWFLFHSFPGCEVPAEQFAALLPVYERALRAGAPFDVELLFVRVLESGGAVPAAARESLARAAAECVLAGGFDSADAMSAIRFVVRALPAEQDLLDRLAEDPGQEKLRWQLALDFALDERSLDDYLAVSYLRDGDPDVARRLDGFPVPSAAKAGVARVFGADGGRERIAAGFAEYAAPEERPMLLEALAEKFPGFAPAGS